MSGKARIHQLAKELGVPAKEVLSWLAGAGEFVGSASSTIERPVARRVREHFQAKNPTAGRRSVNDEAPSSPAGAPRAPRRRPPPRVTAQLTSAQTASICDRFRRAHAAQNCGRRAIAQLYAESEARYGVSRQQIEDIVAEDLLRHPYQYVTSRRPSRPAEDPDRALGEPPADTATGTGDGESTNTSIDDHRGQTTWSRPRTDRLPPAIGVENPQRVADLAEDLDATHREDIGVEDTGTCVRHFTVDDTGDYGYLAWRYSIARRRAPTAPPAPAVRRDLGLIAHVVDTERQHIEHVIRAHGPILEQPGLAKRAIVAEFGDLIDADDIGRSCDDELRRTRARDQFVRHALILVIASPDCDQLLWDMIHQLRPPTPEQLVENNPALAAAIARLSEDIADVQALLSANDLALSRFLRQAHTELAALMARRYDFLRTHRGLENSSATTPQRIIEELPFIILPSGEHLQAAFDGIRARARRGGRHVDDRRVEVLTAISAHFGADRCRWHQGSPRAHGFNDNYFVLTIKSVNGSAEHAVAISPLAGEHATYVVHGDHVTEPWTTILAEPKPTAIARGARRFHFTTSACASDLYAAMRDKVIALLQSPTPEP